MEAAAAASMEAASAALVPSAVADAAASSVAASAAAATAASSSASVPAVVASAVARVAEVSCPNWSPLARAVRCPVGSETLWLPSLGVPAWVLLSHSAQGTLGLFSLKHLLLHQMPTIKSWMEKLRAATNEGRLHAAGSNSSRSTSSSGRAASSTEDDADRPVGLPALLSAPAKEDSRTSSRNEPASLVSSAASSSSSSSSASAPSLPAPPAPPSPHAAHLAMLQQLYEASASDQLASLGTNVHETVLSFFSARELAELMLVSKSWYRAANADHLWTALNEREIMRQFLSPESGLYEVIQGMESDSNAAERLASSSSSSTGRSDAAVVPPKRRSWDAIIRSQQHSICHTVVHIATAWQAHLFSGLHRPSSEIEADLLSDVHQLTQAIAKLNTFLGYIKAAEKHARQVLQRKSGGSSSGSTVAAPTLMSRYESTSALLLTACALVQACHRFCSGVTPAKPRPRISRQPSSTSSSSSASSSANTSTSAASSCPSLAVSAGPAAASMQSIHDEIASQQLSASSGMARDSDLLSQVIEGQEGIRRRRNAPHASAAQLDDALPASAASPALASAASYSGPASSSSSSSSSSPSSAAPPLQRSLSTPAPASPSAARPSLIHLLPERRWQTIGDILLLMEQSGLMQFDFSVAEVIRLHEAPAAAAAAAAQAQPAGNAAASSSMAPAVAAASASSAAAAPAPNDPDDPNDSDSEFGGDDDDGEDEDEDDSGEDSDDSENELPPAPAPAPAPFAGPAVPALPPAHQPAARARHARRWILAADIDELDNIFLTAIPIDEVPKTNAPAQAAGAAMSIGTAPSSAVPATGAGLTDMAALAATSPASSTPVDLTAEMKQDASAVAAPSSSTVPSDHELRQRALALAVDELANDTSRSGTTKRRQPAPAKAAYKESLQFLRVQQGLDESKRDERNLVRSQQQTARLHDLLRHAFKLLIFCSMLWSMRDSGVIQLICRFGAWSCLLWSALSWYGLELELDLDDGAHMQMPPHNHNHAGPGFAQMHMHGAQHDEPPPLPPAPLLPAPLMQPLALALDWFGLMAVGPAAQEQMGAIMPNQIVPQPLPADHAALQQRKRLRRVLLCLSCVVGVESFNYLLGHGNPEWFTQLLLTLVRFTPLSFGITALAMMALSALTWRNRYLQGILLASLMLECAFWTFEFRSRSMELFGLFLWKSVAPRLWKLAVALARVAPVASVLVTLSYMVASMAMIIVPVMMDVILEPAAAPAAAAPVGAANNLLAAHGMPVLNLNPAAQNWPLLFNIVRHNPELRRCYKMFGLTCMASAVAEGAYLFAGFELPWVMDAWAKMRTVAPVLASVAYDLTVTEGRGLVLGLALLRFVWVVDQSLPIATLSILAGGRRAKKSAATAAALRRKESAAAAAGSAPQSSPSLSRQVSEAAAGKPASSSSTGVADASPAVPSVVCLSCARHACPFTLVRWLQDFLFESTLLFCWPLSGVQAMHVQKHEQNMQISDTAQTIKAARQAQRQERKSQDDPSVGSEEDGEDDLPLQVQTCHSCLLHSIRAQLLLPFVYLLVLYVIFSVLLPPPSYSSYRELLFAGAHYLLDRVPCVALFDVLQGWWTGRVLQWKRAYIGLTTAVLAYAIYVVWVSWFHQIGVWYLLPGFLYQPFFNGASWLLLDAAWLVVWTIN